MNANPWAAHGPDWWAGHPVRTIPAAYCEVHQDQDVSWSHVERYRAQPDDGETPCVIETRDGRYVVIDGKHHTLAALLDETSIRAHVALEPAGVTRPQWADAYGPASWALPRAAS